jgi:aminopeptidase N
MTSFWSGGRGGGMETPMMANNGAPRRFQDFVELLFHEAAHTYFPFYMGTNERKYAWMDEGWAAYLPAGMVAEYIPESDYLAEYMDSYTGFAGQEAEMPLMIPSYQHNNFSSARVAAYTRPAMAYHFLRDALGHELFKEALHAYMHRWNGKHPLPYDFFNTFNDVSGEDLSWFWQPWFFEFGYPDLGIKEVRENNEVVIEKVGNIPIPISLYYISENNQSEKFYFNTATWKDGKSEFVVKLSPDLKIKSLELGNEHIPDVDLENNKWNQD